MEKFFATILTLILIFWVLKWVFVLIGPWLLKVFAKRLMKKAGFDQSAFSGASSGQGQQQEAEGDSRTETMKSGKWWKEDEVILKPSRRNGQRISDILGGEYIEYEEVSAS